jgi:hypothetical protein
MALNLGTISRENLDLLLEDLRVPLSEYFQFENWSVPHTVLAKRGTVDVWATPAGIPEDGHRDPEVAEGDDLPKGNLSFDQRQFDTRRYGKNYPVDDGLLRRLESMTDIRDQLAQLAAKDALHGFLRRMRSIFNGTSALPGKQFTSGTLGAGKWNLSTSTPIQDTNLVMKNLGVNPNGTSVVGGEGVIGVIGFDVAQALMVHPQFTGSAAGGGVEHVSFERVRNLFIELGCSQVYIDGTVSQNGERQNPRNYDRIFDGCVAFFHKANLNVVTQQAFEMRFEIDYNKSRAEWGFMAETRRDIIVGDIKHGYYMPAVL